MWATSNGLPAFESRVSSVLIPLPSPLYLNLDLRALGLAFIAAPMTKEHPDVAEPEMKRRKLTLTSFLDPLGVRGVKVFSVLIILNVRSEGSSFLGSVVVARDLTLALKGNSTRHHYVVLIGVP